jgi:uncharacterized protein (TIGR00369 family)
MADKILERLWEMGPNFISGTPHAQKLGMTFVAVDKGRAVMSLPYNKELVGDTKTGVIHGGAVTTLLDQVSGLAALAGFETLGATATLSLRIDYMRAALPEKTILAEAHCYKATKHVAFIRAIAHQGDENDPVATAQSCFMATGPRVRAEDIK